MKRALIVKLGAIGDVVMAVPAVHQLHQLGYAIDWVVNGAAATVLQHYPFVRTIVADERAILRGGMAERLRALSVVWRDLGRVRYDLVVTLYYDRRYRLLSLPVRAGFRVQLSHDDRARELHPGRHHTDEFARILLGAARAAESGVPINDSGPVPQGLPPIAPENLPPSPLPPPTRARIALAPAGARNYLRDDGLRRWPAAHYVELARMLLAQGFEVVLTGGPDDRWIQSVFAGLPCTDLIDRLTLPQLLALFDASDAVVTHDTGPLHLAGTTRCSLLGIFGPVEPWARLPRRDGVAGIWGGEGFACRPCYDGSAYANCSNNQCMAQVTPAFALDVVLGLLEQRKTGELKPTTVYLPPSTRPVSSGMVTL